MILRYMQKWSPEPPLRNTRNITIYLINQARNYNFQNLYLRVLQIYLGKPPLSLRGTLDALERLFQQKSRLSLDTSILRQQQMDGVLSAETLIK